MFIDHAWGVRELGAHSSKQFAYILDRLTESISADLRTSGTDVLLSLVLVLAGEDARDFVAKFLQESLV